MNDRVVPGPVQDSCGIREAVCIHTKKIYDSCREEDMAFYILERLILRRAFPSAPAPPPAHPA